MKCNKEKLHNVTRNEMFNYVEKFIKDCMKKGHAEYVFILDQCNCFYTEICKYIDGFSIIESLRYDKASIKIINNIDYNEKLGEITLKYIDKEDKENEIVIYLLIVKTLKLFLNETYYNDAVSDMDITYYLLDLMYKFVNSTSTMEEHNEKLID